MRVAVQKWGNSLAVRIPKAVATETGLQDGSVVDLRLMQGRVVLSPVCPPRYELQDLLAGVNRRNLHGEWETGPGVGREVW